MYEMLLADIRDAVDPASKRPMEPIAVLREFLAARAETGCIDAYKRLSAPLPPIDDLPLRQLDSKDGSSFQSRVRNCSSISRFAPAQT